MHCFDTRKESNFFRSLFFLVVAGGFLGSDIMTLPSYELSSARQLPREY